MIIKKTLKELRKKHTLRSSGVFESTIAADINMNKAITGGEKKSWLFMS